MPAKTKFRIFDDLPNFESTTLHVSRLSLSQPALSAQLASPPLATGRLTRVLPLCEEWKIRIHFLLRDVYELTFVRPSPLGVGPLSRLPRHSKTDQLYLLVKTVILMPDGIPSLEGGVRYQVTLVGESWMTSLPTLKHPTRHASFAQRTSWCCSVLVVFLISVAAGNAQNLNWEGQTGALVTPFAYTTPSPAKGLGFPAVSFHYLDGGSVLGGFYEVSGTVGFLKRFEAGYTRAQNSDGSVSGLSPLFNGGFNIFHAKANMLGENAGKHNYIPAISLGFVARTNVQRVGGVLNNKDTHNEDFYIVATKTIPYFKRLPLVASLGFKATNGSILGIAGNAPNWQGRFFGAAGFVVPGPVKSKMVFGSEFLQEPRRIEGLPGARLPTTLTYFARVIPRGELPLNIDFGVAQLANQIAPGVKLHARSQFALGVSYRF